jgi:hypothetical protein
MALARILALARVVCGLASAFTLAGIDPKTLDARRFFWRRRGVTDAPFMASAIAAMARPVPDTILFFMLISLENSSRTERHVGRQASPRLLFAGES